MHQQASQRQDKANGKHVGRKPAVDGMRLMW